MKRKKNSPQITFTDHKTEYNSTRTIREQQQQQQQQEPQRRQRQRQWRSWWQSSWTIGHEQEEERGRDAHQLNTNAQIKAQQTNFLCTRCTCPERVGHNFSWDYHTRMRHTPTYSCTYVSTSTSTVTSTATSTSIRTSCACKTEFSKEMDIFWKAAKAGRTRMFIAIIEFLIVIDAEFRKKIIKHVGIWMTYEDNLRITGISNDITC